MQPLPGVNLVAISARRTDDGTSCGSRSCTDSNLSIATAGYFFFCAALLVIIFIDIHHQIIPDVISLPGIILGFLFSLVSPTVTWQSSLIGMLVGGGVLYAVAFDLLSSA